MLSRYLEYVGGKEDDENAKIIQDSLQVYSLRSVWYCMTKAKGNANSQEYDAALMRSLVGLVPNAHMCASTGPHGAAKISRIDSDALDNSNHPSRLCRSQVHTNIIAALKAADADASILDANGHSAQDFDYPRPVGEAVGGVGGAGRLDPPKARPVVPPTGGRDEL